MKIKILFLTLLIAFTITLVPFKAEAVDTSASFGMDVMSQYIWRGVQVSDDSMALQPSITATYGPVSANLWASFDMETDVNLETDYTLSYARSIDKISLDVGAIYYAFGPSIGDTGEVYVSAGYDVLLSPTVTYYQAVDKNIGGAFAVASIGYDVELSNDLVVSLGASASLNLDHPVMGRDINGETFMGLYNAEVSASTSFALPFDENISITPMIAYSFALSDDADDAISAFDEGGAGGESSIFYGGVGISVGF